MTQASPEFPGGIRLFPATQEEIDYVEDNYREGERHEREVENAPPTCLSDFESCWIAKAANGDVLGYFGVLVMPNHSVMSRTRALCFMSCENANRHKLAFVKASRPVLRWIVRQCPKWTDTYLSWPLESYKASVRWQEKVLGMRRVAYVPAAPGERYVVLETTRGEVESWR